MTPKAVRRLQQLRYELLAAPHEDVGEEVIAKPVAAAA